MEVRQKYTIHYSLPTDGRSYFSQVQDHYIVLRHSHNWLLPWTCSYCCSNCFSLLLSGHYFKQPGLTTLIYTPHSKRMHQLTLLKLHTRFKHLQLRTYRFQRKHNWLHINCCTTLIVAKYVSLSLS